MTPPGPIAPPFTPPADAGVSQAPARDRWWALALGLAALVLYVATLAPTVATVFDDSLEFQVVLPSLGIAHPTGYPLYTLLGWAFSRLPVGDLAFRVNLLSAIAGAATVGLLFLVARRLGSTRLAAAATTAVFALSTTWWSQATIAEVYTLHGLFVALILFLTLSLDGPGHPIPNERGDSTLQAPPNTLRPRRLAALAFLFGLALSHHRMTLLLAPAVAVTVLWTDPGLLRRPRDLALMAGAFLLPLLLYAYLPLRGLAITSLDGTYTNTVQGFVRHILASDYGAFFRDNPLAIDRPRDYPLRLLASQMGIASLVLGLAGWLRWGRQPKRWTFMAIAFATTLLFAIGYRTADVDVFYLPATMIWLAVAAVGLTIVQQALAALWARIDERAALPGSLRLWVAVTDVALVAVVLVQPAVTTMRLLRSEVRPQACDETLAVGEAPAFTPKRAGNWNAANCGRAILSLPLPSQSIVVGLLGETSLLRYFQLADGIRTDVELVTADAEPARLAAVDGAMAAERPVFVTRELSGLAERYSLTSEGPLVRVWPAGQAAPDSLANPVDVPFGDALRLVGWDLAPVPATGADWLRLRAAWRVDSAVGEDLKVSARLLAPDGSVVASKDVVPVHWSYPTTAWRPGDTVVDSFDFALPAGSAADSLAPLIILYRAADGSEVGRFQP